MQLLERQQQLESLRRCLQEARAGSGKLVLIAAEAGLGKSALVEQFVAQIGSDARTIWGACDALDTPRALGPVHEIATQTPVLAEQSLPLNQPREWLFRALFEQLMQRQRPYVVVLEDLHWADEATLDFFRFISRRIQRTSALLIVTYRDEELPLTHPVRLAVGELMGDHIIRTRLQPLTVAAVEQLAADSGWDPANLHRTTGGNPFFVREALASRGDRVPQTVRDAVLSRLQRCSIATRELAELVSMSPGRTAEWLIEAVVGVRLDAIEEGVNRGLLLASKGTVGFRHELARLAIRSTVPPERARSLHDRLLCALIERGADLSEIVHHAVLADNAAAILEHAPLAGREAARLGAHREAAAHFGAALPYRAALPAARQAELLELHARECSVANQGERAIASWQQALTLRRQLGEIEHQSLLHSFLGPQYREAGERARADECIATAIALLEPLPQSAHLAAAYSARARVASNRGLDREALEFGQRALLLARKFNDRETESHVLNTIGSALLIAGEPSGYEPLEQSLAIALQFDLQECVARAYCNLVFCTTLVHDFTRAARFLAKGHAYCEERGLFASIAYMQVYGCRLALERGEWLEAARIATELSQGAALMSFQRVPMLATLALLHTRRDDAAADELLDQALELALPTGEPERIGRVCAARAERAYYRGDLDRLAREASAGLEQLRDLRIPWIKGELLWWLSRAHSVELPRDDIAPPYRLMIEGDWLQAARAWESFGMPYEQALALMEGPEQALRDALAILDRLGGGPLAAIARRRLRERGVRGVPRGPNESTRANPVGLTAREIEILSLLVHGCSNAQLAQRLHRSPKTIGHHISAILGKLGVHSRTEALAAAMALGIVSAPVKQAGSRRRAKAPL
jgi:ATP/maltotriose-dependent transcriptional regulator MalT